MGWYQKESNDVLKEQTVSFENGLSAVIAKQRLDKFGPNQLKAGKKINPLMLFLGQFKDVLIIILLVAALVSRVLG